MPPLEAYRRELPYAYALGLFPALEALNKAPERVSRVLVHSRLGEGEGAQSLLAACAQRGIRVEQADRLLRRLSGKDNCYAAAVFRKQEAGLLPGSNHLVLVNPMDGGNLGTILRSALGFGYFDIALILPCADVYEPAVVRASMGALFCLRIREYESFEAYQQEAGQRSLYPFMLSDQAQPLAAAVLNKKSPHSLVFGNEGSGLPDSFLSLGQAIKIEQSDQIDSLNLAVSAAIGMYQFSDK